VYRLSAAAIEWSIKMLSLVPTLALFGGIGTPELMVILVVALLLFGPKNLPKMARTLGKSMEEFRRAANEVQHELLREPEPAPALPGLPPPPEVVGVPPKMLAAANPAPAPEPAAPPAGAPAPETVAAVATSAAGTATEPVAPGPSAA